MSRRRRKRGRLKWIMLGVTVLLAVACGPWELSYNGSNQSARESFVVIGGGVFELGRVGLSMPADVIWGPPFPGWFCRFTIPNLRMPVLPGYRVVTDPSSGEVVFRHFSASMWPPLLLCVVLTTLLFWRDWRRIPPGHCPNCAYDLTGNVSGRCPECGAAVE